MVDLLSHVRVIYLEVYVISSRFVEYITVILSDCKRLLRYFITLKASLLYYHIVGVTGVPLKVKYCKMVCPVFVIELCGSDGKTYRSNECVLKSQFCL